PSAAGRGGGAVSAPRPTARPGGGARSVLRRRGRFRVRAGPVRGGRGRPACARRAGVLTRRARIDRPRGPAYFPDHPFVLTDFLARMPKARSARNDPRATCLRDSETQAQYAYRQIEEMIVTLALPPGSRISEKSISAQLGIGRAPVREALQRLAYERTIKVLPRSGAVVSEIDIAEHFKLIEVRRELERILVGRAARLAEPLVCRRFEELAVRFREAADR